MPFGTLYLFFCASCDIVLRNSSYFYFCSSGKLLFLYIYLVSLFLTFRRIPSEYTPVCGTLLESSSLSLESVPSFFPRIIATNRGRGIQMHLAP